MKDLVIAVYRKDCYAGETTLHLVNVLLPNTKFPDQYKSCEYETRAMFLVDCFTETKQKGENQ